MATFNGTAAAERLEGGSENDVFAGLGGADTFVGGAGFDGVEYVSSPAGVVVDLGAGTAQDGHGATDTLIDIEQVYGSEFADRIVGSAQSNYLLGRAGDDLIFGLDESDFLDGFGGNDTLDGGNGGDILAPGDGADLVRGGGGFDTVDYSNLTASVVVELYNTTYKGLTQDALDSVENITGTNFNDELKGTFEPNIILARAGNDTIYGREGKDFLRGEEGDDLIFGGTDFDDAHGNMGNDTVHGEGGDDWVVGGKDNDVLYGGDGFDVVYGNLGIDTNNGDAGNDWVRGGQQDDILNGGAGDDWLSGDRDNDTISGGSGADTFNFFADAGIDRVTDFNFAEGDRVRLEPGSTYTAAQVGADTVITVGAGQMTLVNVQLSTLSSGWIYVA